MVRLLAWVVVGVCLTGAVSCRTSKSTSSHIEESQATEYTETTSSILHSVEHTDSQTQSWWRWMADNLSISLSADSIVSPEGIIYSPKIHFEASNVNGVAQTTAHLEEEANTFDSSEARKESKEEKHIDTDTQLQQSAEAFVPNWVCWLGLALIGSSILWPILKVKL